MIRKTGKKGKLLRIWKIVALAAIAASGSAPVMAEDLPSMGEESSPWKTDVFYENDTHVRGKDHTGRSIGLSKFRNTLQIESDKGLGDGWAFHSVLRGTWDGVYQMNDSKFGDKAGGAIQLENIGGPAGAPPFASSAPTVPWGGGVNGASPFVGLGFNSTNPNAPNYNPNQGLEVLGASWHNTNGGVAFGVPVRPCDTDSRGCADFGGYGNLKKSELESPEFN
ncbi:MAG: DUF1302 domain-containing protein, partial [Rhodocyclaceae bacterium]